MIVREEVHLFSSFLHTLFLEVSVCSKFLVGKYVVLFFLFSFFLLETLGQSVMMKCSKMF